jgi:DNA-binding XRE family transcriptional regulator
MPPKRDHLTAIDDALDVVRRRVSEAVAAAAMPDRSKVTLGQMIRQRRKALGLSLDQVAQAAGCTKSHIWEMEQDRSRNPTVSMVWGLAGALSVPFPVIAAAALETILRQQ